MNQEQFLLDLKKRLRKLPKDEIDNILLYYKDYFEDSEKDYEEVIKDLGSTSAIASQILADYAFDDRKEKRGIGYKVLLIILAILAAPVGFPLAIAGVAILLAIAVSIGAVLLAFGAVAAGFCIAGMQYVWGERQFFLRSLQHPYSIWVEAS